MHKRLKFLSITFGSCLFYKINCEKNFLHAFNDFNEKFKTIILKKETDVYIWGNGHINNTSKFLNFHPHRIKKFILYSNLQNYINKLINVPNTEINTANNLINFSNLTNFYKDDFNSELIKNNQETHYNFIDISFNEYISAAIDKNFDLYAWREPKLNAEKEKNINNHLRIGITRLAENNKVIETKLTKDKLFFIDDKGDVYFYKINISQPKSEDFFESSLPEPEITIDSNNLIKVKEFSNIKTLAVGKDHILALDINGVLYGMGDDSFGQLGLGTYTEEREQHMKMYNNFIERRERFPKKIEIPEKIIKIACGENHSLALSADGNVYGFGFNRFLQLSNDQIYRQKIIGLNIPTIITKDKFRNLKILDIAASKNCSFFMAKDKDNSYKFFSAGEGLRGQLGQNVIKHMSDVELMPDISGLINSDNLKPFEPLKMSCGSNHCLLLFKNPRIIYVWGNNEYGELGTKDRVYYESPIPILEEYSLPFKVVNISAGYKSSAFICERVDSLKKKEILNKDRIMLEDEMSKKKKKKNRRNVENNEDKDLILKEKGFLINKIEYFYTEIKKYL